MKRVLSGSLEHLSPTSLLRLVSATSPSGKLELDTADGSLRLEVDRGRVRMPSKAELEIAGRILGCRRGEFRFTPGDVASFAGEALSLTAFAEAAGGAASDVELDRLLAEELLEVAGPENRPKIHVLPIAPPVNPLDDLVSGLDVGAPVELSHAEIGVMAQDPRWWRGTLEHEWQQRGWTIRQLSFDDAIDLAAVDVVVVHHHGSSAWAGREEQWLEMVAAANELEPPVPVVWVTPVGDPVWVQRLIRAGVAFLIPAHPADSGEAATQFAEVVSLVVERNLQSRAGAEHTILPSGVSELVGALLSEHDPDQGIASLLQLAAEHFTRGAVLMVEESAFRCRAGFEYPLDRDRTTLPRGIDLLERVIGEGEAVMSVEPDSDDGQQLAAVMGVDRLVPETALIPLGRSGTVAGVLVADRHGEDLPDLADLVRLAGRLGGAAVS